MNLASIPYSPSVYCIINYHHLPQSFLRSIVYYLTKCCRIMLCHSASGPQPPPCLGNRYIFIQNWPCTGAGHQSALCLQPLPRHSAPCLSGWGLVIELSMALFWLAISSLFFLSAPKSWPIYSNPIIIEAWLSRVIDGTLLKPGYC